MTLFEAKPAAPPPTPVLLDTSRILGAALAGSATAAPGAAAWPAANRAILVPFETDEAITVVSLFAFNGGVVGGNVDLGIYNAQFGRLVSTGSFAQTLGSVPEGAAVNFALGPGRYYLACAKNDVNQVFAWVPIAGIARAWGLAQMASAFPLPATITPAVIASAHVPWLGLSLRALV